MENISNILSFADLEIGYKTRRETKILTPPLNASATDGELIAVIGHNGVGKSTLLRTITAIHPPLGGEIFLEGKDIREYDRVEIAKRIAYISTETVRTGNMSVYDLVALGRYPHTNWFGITGREDNDIIMDSIVKTGMERFTSKNISDLSDGERQRAMIARALAQDTGLLIMDEPTAFLDIKNKFEIVHLMQVLARKRGKTVIFSTHDLQTALNEADKIWMILDSGLIEGAPEDLVINGSPDLLFSDPLLAFNRSEGTFIINREVTGSIQLNGSGVEALWTSKALARAGFETTTSPAELTVTILLIGEKPVWKLKGSGISVEFDTIYGLIKQIRLL